MIEHIHLANPWQKHCAANYNGLPIWLRTAIYGYIYKKLRHPRIVSIDFATFTQDFGRLICKVVWFDWNSLIDSLPESRYYTVQGFNLCPYGSKGAIYTTGVQSKRERKRWKRRGRQETKQQLRNHDND